MTPAFETGHAKNVSNFDELISFVTAYGAIYNPSKASIKLPALQIIAANAQKSITELNNTMPAYSNAVAAREAAFEPLSKLTTRILNALKATDTTTHVIDIVKTPIRKIQGTRATAKKTEEEKQALQAEGKEVKEISASQMSYDNRLDNFDKLIKLLAAIPAYLPNESELKVATLTNIFTDLKAKNAAVIKAAIPLSNARLARNEILYKSTTGLYDIAKSVKIYVKSIFDTTSPQYKQISGLKFTKPR